MVITQWAPRSLYKRAAFRLNGLLISTSRLIWWYFWCLRCLSDLHPFLINLECEQVLSQWGDSLRCLQKAFYSESRRSLSDCMVVSSLLDVTLVTLQILMAYHTVVLPVAQRGLLNYFLSKIFCLKVSNAATNVINNFLYASLRYFVQNLLWCNQCV